MKKVRFTRNDLTGRPVIKICYCGAYELLRGLEPVGYMAGVYGWNCDVYDAGAAWIVTGYRMPVNGVYPDWDYLTEANKAAAQAYKADWLEYSVRLEYIGRIRAEFIRGVITEANKAAAGIRIDEFNLTFTDNSVTVLDTTTGSKKTLHVRTPNRSAALQRGGMPTPRIPMLSSTAAAIRSPARRQYPGS